MEAGTKGMTLNPSSLKAYINEIAPTLNPRQIQVLEVLEGHTEDMTNMEIAAALEWSINRVTGRVKELRDRGFLEESSHRPCSVTGRPVNAWRIKEKPSISPQALRRAPAFYQLPSRSNAAGMHVLRDNGKRLTCSCRGFYFSDLKNPGKGTCRHIGQLKKPDPRESMTSLFT
jgi:hypothetical protein